MPFHVYIMQSEKDGTYYVGSTQNLERRLAGHNQGRLKHTKPKRPWKLVYRERHPNRASALNRENEIKRRKEPVFIEILIRMARPFPYLLSRT